MSAVKDIKPPNSEKPKGEAKGNKGTTADKPKTRALPYESKLKEFFLTIAGVIALSDTFTATIIENKADELAHGYAKLAQEDSRVKNVLARILEGSAWSAALMPTVTVMVAILWHHGIFVPDRLGVPMAMANGVMPVTREQELQMKIQAEQEQAEAAARAGANGNHSAQ